jgi:hypothetical protein
LRHLSRRVVRVEIGQKPGVVRGTGSSNPSPSSGESANFRFLSGGAQPWVRQRWGSGRAPLVWAVGDGGAGASATRWRGSRSSGWWRVQPTGYGSLLPCSSYFFRVPEKTPRTVWRCHPVALATSSTVAPSGRRSMSRTSSCFDGRFASGCGSGSWQGLDGRPQLIDQRRAAAETRL